MHGISALMRETSESSHAFHPVRTVKRQLFMNKEAGFHQTPNLLVPGSWTSQRPGQ